MDTPEQDGIGRSALRGEPPIIQGRFQTTGLDLGHFRLLAQAKPCTKAAQVRQFWPEIKIALTAGHRLKDIRNWLNEAGIEIGNARLSDYVCELKRRETLLETSTPLSQKRRSPVVQDKSTIGRRTKRRGIQVKIHGSAGNVRVDKYQRPSTPDRSAGIDLVQATKDRKTGERSAKPSPLQPLPCSDEDVSMESWGHGRFGTSMFLICAALLFALGFGVGRML